MKSFVRGGVCFLVALALVTLNSGIAAAQRKTSSKTHPLYQVCSKVLKVTGPEFLYKSEISHHIPGADARASGPTFICNRLCPSSFPASIYYSDGTEAAKLGYYGTWSRSHGGTGRPRAYCAAGGASACSNSTMALRSRQRGVNGKRRDGKLYVSMGRGRPCYQVNPLGRTGRPR